MEIKDAGELNLVDTYSVLQDAIKTTDVKTRKEKLGKVALDFSKHFGINPKMPINPPTAFRKTGDQFVDFPEENKNLVIAYPDLNQSLVMKVDDPLPTEGAVLLSFAICKSGVKPNTTSLEQNQVLFVMEAKFKHTGELEETTRRIGNNSDYPDKPISYQQKVNIFDWVPGFKTILGVK